MSVTQTARCISTYTGDSSGVCAALFEWGGMTVIHDPSGCNSTYNTHDEPRWYDTDSLVFISGLSEMEAILGDDQKLVQDIVDTARALSPRFIAIAGSPIPMMTGVDLPAIARQIEAQTGIPSFGLPTNGMHSYISGASLAFAAFARRLPAVPKAEALSVNLLGVTPLDFSVNGSDRSLRAACETAGIPVNSVWAMGSSWEEIQNSSKARVNLVVSACGLAAARVLEERFGIPYIIGVPIGKTLTGTINDALRTAAATGKSRSLFPANAPSAADTVIIGESVSALSLSAALLGDTGQASTVLCPVESDSLLLSPHCLPATDEADLLPYLKRARTVIADPLYRPICPKGTRFINLPHEAFSGRIYRDRIPDLIADFHTFKEELL